MSLAETTAAGQSESISFECDLPHPPEKVWRALTDPALVSEWLLPAVGMKLEPGATFTFQAPPQPGWDGIVNCRVLEVEARKKLTYAWVVGDIDTVVTFDVAPTPAGTRLSLVQSGFRTDQKRNFAGARYGWNMMGGKLVDLLERMP
jgi:uncharacterized protein YndB with AHSA1/START domain